MLLKLVDNLEGCGWWSTIWIIIHNLINYQPTSEATWTFFWIFVRRLDSYFEYRSTSGSSTSFWIIKNHPDDQPSTWLSTIVCISLHNLDQHLDRHPSPSYKLLIYQQSISTDIYWPLVYHPSSGLSFMIRKVIHTIWIIIHHLDLHTEPSKLSTII